MHGVFMQCDNCAKCPLYCSTVYKARLNMCDRFVQRIPERPGEYLYTLRGPNYGEKYEE